MRVLCRRCRRVFGSHCGIDDIGGSAGPRAWRRAWSRRWPRTRSWLGTRSWPRLGHCRPGLLFQPALGPRDLPVLIRLPAFRPKHRRCAGSLARLFYFRRLWFSTDAHFNSNPTHRGNHFAGRLRYPAAHRNLKFKAARMPEWLHLLGVGVVLAGCGWIGFAPINVEWFWVPHDDDLAVIIIGPRAASCDAGNSPHHGA